MKKILMVFLSVFIVSSFSAFPVFSQDNTETDEKAKVVKDEPAVKKDAKKATGVFTIGEIVVRDRAIANMEDAGTTTELTAEDLEAHGSKDLGDALKHIPGIKVEAGSDGSTGFKMRGFRDAKVNVLVDGLPVQDGFKESLDASRIPVQNIAKIVVNKGSSSALYGSVGSIGTINIITKKPEREFAKTSIELGTLENNSYNISMGAPMGNFYYWMNASARVSDGYDVSNNLDKKERRAWSKRLIRSHLVGVEYDDLIKDTNDPDEIPPVVDPNYISALDNYVNKEEWHKTNYKKYQVAGKFGYEISKNLEIGVSMDYYTGEQYGYSPEPDALYSYNGKGTPLQWSAPDANDLFDGGYSGFPKDYNYKISPYFLFSDGMFSIKGNFFFRKQQNIYELFLDPEKTQYKWPATPWFDYSIGGNLYPSIKIASWNKLNFAISFKHDNHKEEDIFGKKITDISGQQLTLAVEEEISLFDMLKVTAGISYDAKNLSTFKESPFSKSTRTYGDLSKQTKVDDDNTIWGTADSFNPVLGIVLEPIKDFLIVRANGSIKTQFPSLDAYTSKLDNNELKAEKSYNAGGGFEIFFLDKALSLRGDYFYNYFNDKIDSFYGTSGKVTTNHGDLTSQGAEITISSSFENIANLLDIDFGFAYAYIRMRIDDDGTPDPNINKGDKYEDTPEHQFMADVRCKFHNGLGVTVSALHERNAIMYAMKEAPQTTVPEAYSTKYFKEVSLHNPVKIDVKISQKFKNQFTLYVMCKNVTDDYDTNPFDPGPGRMWYFGGSAEL